MGTFKRVYSDDQRAAIEHAWSERRVRPAARIVELARAGELATPAGEPLEPFHVPEQSVRDLGRRYLRRRAGLERSRLAELEPRDAIETLRRRLVSAADHELEAIERLQARRRDVPAERIRQAARAVREISALPSSSGTPAPGQSPELGRRTRGGLAGQILRAGERGASSSAPAPEHEREPDRINGAELGPVPDAPLEHDASSSDASSSAGAHV